jgi:hypothetical protein
VNQDSSSGHGRAKREPTPRHHHGEILSTHSCVESLRRRFLGKHSSSAKSEARTSSMILVHKANHTSNGNVSQPTVDSTTLSSHLKPVKQATHYNMMSLTLLDSNVDRLRETAEDDGPRKSRTRSRAIAIKPNSSNKFHRAHNDVVGDDENLGNTPTCDKMYDWATWRLYHRIIDHRQKYPLSPAYYESDASSDASPTSTAAFEDHVFAPASSMKQTSLRQPDSTLDGEVFELEI